MPQESPAFKIKNANPTLLVVNVLTNDLDTFKRQLAVKFQQAPDFFADAPMALGLAAITEDTLVPDFADLAAFLRQQGPCLIGVTGGSVEQRQAARAAGLGLFPDGPTARSSTRTVEAEPTTPAPPVMPESAPPEPTAQEATPSAEPDMPALPAARPTVLIDKPVRTGQRIHAPGADLVVLAIVNAGAELIADGDIHVYAPLRGRALAGAHGNTHARIFAQAMEAELVSIAGLFQVFEDGIPTEVRGKPSQVYLDGEKVILKPLPSSR